MTTDKPILFSGPMVRALLDGRKTQTRRVLKPQPKWTNDAWYWQSPRYDNGGGANYFHTPHVAGIMSTWVKAMPYAIGDRLWVREAHYLTNKHAYRLSVGVDQRINPRDDYEACVFKEGFDRSTGGLRLRPSIHMPRWASRLTLVVTDVRVQRVQEVTLGDICAEGLARSIYDFKPVQTGFDAWRELWDSLNAERGFGWDDNPWVAAYTFTVHKCNIDQMESEDDEV